MTGFIRQSFRDLLYRIPISFHAASDSLDVQITGIAYDSRKVEMGNIFVALRGGNLDGHQFISHAIERGAVGIVGLDDIRDLHVPYVQVEDTRLALAWLSAAFYNFPARHLTVIGVTGTDGKTTTSNLIYQILLEAGYKAGIISTINAAIGNEIVDTGFHVTTPEAPDIQRYLARMLAAGLTHVVLETTSHGLAQNRVVGCEYDIGVMTNISHEHLDFHRSFDLYRDAKLKLFQLLSESEWKSFFPCKLAVLNRDDPSYDYLASRIQVQVVSYSKEKCGELWADEVEYSPKGLCFTVVGPSFRQSIHSHLVGDYNVSNILAAIGASVFGLKISPEIASQGIKKIKGIPGRMESIDLGQSFMALVDFAHTPNALANVLRTARKMTAQRLIAVFGSAGLRDRQKRRMMAEVAAELADISILTAEDPRTESLDQILAEMADGMYARNMVEGESFHIERDRGEAIRLGIRLARAGDILLILGKGHEQSMCFGEIEYPWDDRVALRSALAEFLEIPGPKMPYLPTQNQHK